MQLSIVELPRFGGRCWACGKSLMLVTPLVVDRRQIDEGGVAAMRVIPPLDELEDGHAGLGLGFEAAAVEQLAFEHGEKTLAHGVVETVADRTHRGPHPGLVAAFAESQRGVLAALVGMVNHGGGAGAARAPC